LSNRTVTILAVVVGLLVVSGAALAIGGQLGGEDPLAQAAANPAVEITRPPATAGSGLTTIPLTNNAATDTTVINLSDSIATLTSPGSTTTTQSATVPTTTTTVKPTTTTLAPTTTTVAPTTTTTVAPTTTTTVAPTTTTTTATAGGAFSSSGESQMVALLNAERAALGVAPLSVDPSLTTYARNWTYYMSSTETFEHSDLSFGGYGYRGENIAQNWSVSGAHNSFVGSPGHYANMTNAVFTHVGVGVWIDDDGKLWTTHVFGG